MTMWCHIKYNNWPVQTKCYQVGALFSAALLKSWVKVVLLVILLIRTKDYIWFVRPGCRWSVGGVTNEVVTSSSSSFSQTVRKQFFFSRLGWWGRLGAQRRAVWGGCEWKVSWAEHWVGVWVEPSSPVQSAALTEPSLWLFSRGS